MNHELLVKAVEMPDLGLARAHPQRQLYGQPANGFHPRRDEESRHNNQLLN